ncbi:D-alanine--D-alanine ligase [Acidithiobacillus montserratensis]|uniref:D-alanine--D-alanine ligase n=1 Tax=Acidithiobacillus montserratensis TaxID=2729135 RepID=A0ACD5HGH5_9PROT|nr:D-alanine--D-alanine ligase [Acidithiobacillus montserratensis]MBN2679870.1 D-alanine--D-alanine ligase [Acidithiobacillaceae bacterium]MBU2749218.1 D-alanine--D-alanine ligase [Acidithiobacillus montserratensis]
MLDVLRIGVLCGGPSGEREVSLLSAEAVLTALRSNGIKAVSIDIEPARLQQQLQDAQVDFAFNVCHGAIGEDGLLQAVLETLHIPYTGSGVLSSALAMDKWRSKQIWKAAGLPVTQGILLRPGQPLPELENSWKWPLYVKPNHGGSSLGVSRVNGPEALDAALAQAFALEDEVLCEAGVIGHEATVGIVDGRALPPIVIETSHAFYDYDAKYLADDTRYLLPSGLGAVKDGELQELALKAFAELGGRDWGRVDFMISQSGKIHILEINSVPGMTSHSLVPMAAKAVGMSFPELCETILRTAQRRVNHG